MQEVMQPGQASPPGRADAAHRKSQLVRYLRIRSRRIRHQQLKHLLPLPRQAQQGLADHLGTLGGQQAFVDLRLMRGHALQGDAVVGEHDFLSRRQTSQALVPRRSRQPGTHPIRVLDAINVLKQAQPRRLGDIRRIALDQLEIPGNGPDKPRILVDQPLPRTPVPRRGAAHELRDVQGVTFIFVRRHRPCRNDGHSKSLPVPCDYRTKSLMSGLSPHRETPGGIHRLATMRQHLP